MPLEFAQNDAEVAPGVRGPVNSQVDRDSICVDRLLEAIDAAQIDRPIEMRNREVGSCDAEARVHIDDFGHPPELFERCGQREVDLGASWVDFDAAGQRARNLIGPPSLLVEVRQQLQQIGVAPVLRQRSQKKLLRVVDAPLRQQIADLSDQRMVLGETLPLHCRRFTPMALSASTTFSTQKPIRFLCNSTSGDSAW